MRKLSPLLLTLCMFACVSAQGWAHIAISQTRNQTDQDFTNGFEEIQATQVVRWLSEDPIQEEGGINLYAYVGNKVIKATDPMGLFNGNDLMDMERDMEIWVNSIYRKVTGRSGQEDISNAIASAEIAAIGGPAAKTLSTCNYFGKNDGLLNNNPYLRIGWGWKGSKDTGKNVFRIAWGRNEKSLFRGHFDIWTE